jgi:hypothetical protein
MDEKKINTDNQEISSVTEENLGEVSGGYKSLHSEASIGMEADRQFSNNGETPLSIPMPKLNLVRDTLDSGEKLKKATLDKAQIWHEKAQIWHEKE